MLTFSKETIEKPLHGSILVPQPGTSPSQVSSNTTSGTFSHCNFFSYFSWFFTILAAEHLGIFSYWRIDVLSGAGDNTDEESDV